jgi:sensor c-di-GMP phosphodiesterase-like protein
LPVDILKLDRSFIGSIGDEDALPSIVTAIIELARTLRLDIVAEGIELPHQRRELEARDCAHGQGYLFARPLSVEDAAELLRCGGARDDAPGAAADV